MGDEDDDREAWRWWERQEPRRRRQIHRWIESLDKKDSGEIPGQLMIDGREVTQ